MFNFSKRIAATCLCGALMMVTNAEAALVNYDFNGVVDSGSLLGEVYTGHFAYDNASPGLTNSGYESVDLSALTFNFLSAAFDLADADTTATADFLDGVFLGLSYSVSSFDPSFALVSSPGLGDQPYFAYQPISGEAGFGSFNLASVPLPGAVWLFGSVLGLFTVIRRKTAV